MMTNPLTGLTRRRWVRSAIMLMVGGSIAGCSVSDLLDSKLPPLTVDAKDLSTEEGAVAVYRGTIWGFRRAFGGQSKAYILKSGIFTDELSTGAYATTTVPALQVNSGDELDYRGMPEDKTLRSNVVESWYRDFNMARNTASDAIYYLRNFAPNTPKDLVSHMFAIQGWSVLFITDIFCSGIPFSEYKSPGGFVYTAGISTNEAYTKAVALFDSALATVHDSANYRYLAQIGKGRALLNLGKFDEAKAAVQGVPTNFIYKALFAVDYSGSFSNNWTNGVSLTTQLEGDIGTIGNREGINGLPFASSNDPRIPLMEAPTQNSSYPSTVYKLPAWMFPDSTIDRAWNRPRSQGTGKEVRGAEDLMVTNGIAARLIEAEVAAKAGDASFLTILNGLRTTCVVVAGCPTPAPAGSGGVAGLPPLTDPGSANARIKMVFDERAYWLFLTGNRQGDLRRLVRVYNWPQDQVYPTGYYPKGEAASYGSFTNIPIPYTEQAINAQYKGCINRDA